MPDSFPAILPKPVEIKLGIGHCVISGDTPIIADQPNRANAAWLAEFLPNGDGAGSAGERSVIRLKCGGELQLGSQQKEGYLLEVRENGITILAPTPAGVFYGLQTLRQLLPVELEKQAAIKASTWQVPCLFIRDWPRFAWRGFMLDEGRHFHGMSTVKLYLDLMALHKLNVFHWHLTEDQGWRIHIQRYPRLTEVGARRPGSAPGFLGKPDGIPHAGFYQPEQIREIVAYAAARHIQVIPEIDMPGHSLAALAAYPEFGCSGGPYQVSQKWGIFPELYCPGREPTFAFLQDILAEVIDLFPSRFIHLGGDETPARRWKSCPHCQARIRTEGLGDESGLKVYFMNRMAGWLAQHGRTPIGWSEVLQPGLDENMILQYWVGKPARFLNALRQGRHMLMSPYMDAYLDHSYALTPLSRAYAWEPVSWNMEPGLEHQIHGLEAVLWSEFVPNRKRLDYQVFPRLCAFAETGWTSGQAKDFADFQHRLGVFEKRLELLGVASARAWQVEPPWYRRMFGILSLARRQKATAD